MGRGRAKAKQTKKARELKYSSTSLDADALQRELAGVPLSSDNDDAEPDDDESDDDYR